MTLFAGNYRIQVLILSTACLSIMFSNILTLNFTILCMTEEKFRWENFTIDLGIDIFEKVDFDPPRPPEEKPPEIPETDWKIPSFELPGVPTPGFNWRTLELAKTNPSLFLRILKKVVKEVSWRLAQRTGQALDPRNIDFRKFKDGFNLTEYDPNVVLKIKDYLLNKIKASKDLYDLIDAEGRNLSEWRNVRLEDIELRNITWNGQINGRIKILERPADHYYTNTERAILFSAIALGGILFIFPLGKTFTIVGLISAITTALCPLAAYLGFIPFVIVRLLQGIGFAACFPVIGCVSSAWAKPTENGIFYAALTGFIQLAPVITFPLSGLLCASILGWRAVYYVHAILTLLLIVLWWFMYRDFPSELHPRKVSVNELGQIQRGKTIDGRRKHNAVKLPLKDFLKTPSVWAVWVAAFGNMYAILMLISFAPTFIKEVLKYPIVIVGFAAAIPTLLQFSVKIFTGVFGDKVLKLNETPKVKIFNSVAFIGMAIFLILLGFIVSEETGLISLIFLILSVKLLGLNIGGFFKSAMLLGKTHNLFVHSVIQAIMCIALVLASFLVYGITSENAPAQWTCVFCIVVVILVATNIFFAIFGQGTAAAFAKFNDEGSRLSTTLSNANAEQSKPIIKEPKFQEVNTPENNA